MVEEANFQTLSYFLKYFSSQSTNAFILFCEYILEALGKFGRAIWYSHISNLTYRF